MARCFFLLIACLSISFFFIHSPSLAQPALMWSNTYGGTQSDQARSIVRTSDSGYIFAGSTQSKDGDVTQHFGGYDVWVVKLDRNGVIQWQRSFGGSGLDEANSIAETFDHGFIVAGQTQSYDSILLGELHGGKAAPSDGWVLKLDSIGKLEWQHTYGGTAADVCSAIIQTSDSGYAFVGTTHSRDGDCAGNKGLSNMWVAKLTPQGAVSWSKCFGGPSEDGGNAIIQASNGDLLSAGFASSVGGEVSGNHGGYDFWVVRMDTSGTIKWTTAYGGTGQDIANALIQTSDHGFAVAGSTVSNDKEVTGLHNPSGGNSDCWLVKTDTAGVLQWSKTFGGSGEDYAYSMFQTSDQGYAIAATTLSSDGDVYGFLGGTSDMWVVRMDATGKIAWQETHGGSGTDQGYSIVPSLDGGYVVAGETASGDSDIQTLHSFNVSDAWVVKLGPALESTPSSGIPAQSLSIFPNPGTGSEELALELDRTSDVRIVVSNAIGQVVSQSHPGILASGKHKVGMHLSMLPAGEYFLSAQVGESLLHLAFIIAR